MNLTVHYDTPMNVNGTEYRVQRFDGLEPLLSEELRFIEGIGTTMYGSLADMTLALISGIWDNSAYPGIQSELVSVKGQRRHNPLQQIRTRICPSPEGGQGLDLERS